jgi:hypothetical protein
LLFLVAQVPVSIIEKAFAIWSRFCSARWASIPASDSSALSFTHEGRLSR